MIRSMTGYGRCQCSIEGRDILFEIKSVNHRYFEFSARVPRIYGYLEDKMKSYIQSQISRGKVEVNLMIVNVDSADTQVEINHSLAQSYVNALRELNQTLNLRDDISLMGITRFADIFVVRKVEEDQEIIWQSVKQAADNALAGFISMRETEGLRMKQDILSRLSAISEAVTKVEDKSPQTVAEYRNKLYNKMCEVLNDSKVDEQRILTEVAIYADKVAVDEETVRLKSHICQFNEMLQSPEPVGRKLDFLVQEINREANTIGSKAQDVEIARIVVDIKADIEKIREQIQNIE